MSFSDPTGVPFNPIDSSEPEERVQAAEADLRLAAHGPMVSAHGASGLRIAARDLRRIAVWQLTGPMERVLTDSERDDVPSAEAVPIWYFGANGTPPENAYADASDYSRSVRVYHVGGLPGDVRDQVVALENNQPGALGVPKFGSGDRVYAEFNNQSGRWEILAPAEDVWRFELKTALVPNGNPNVPSTADAYLVVYDAGQGSYVKTSVEFQVADFLDVWDADPGCRGYAKRFADAHASVGWEVLTMNTSPSGSSSCSG